MNGTKAQIFGIPLFSTSLEEVLNTIDKNCSDYLSAESEANFNQKLILFTPNPEFMVEAQKNNDFKEMLKKSDLNLIDGIGLILVGKIFGQKIKSRVSGADLVEKLLTLSNVKKWPIGLVDIRRGDLVEQAKAIKILQEKYPGITFVNFDHPQLEIKTLKMAVVFACHGMVKQEDWILKNKDKIPAKVFIGVGGSFDFLTGFTKRAPVFIRRIGFEWLWRGIQRPKHFKRIWKATFVFGWLVFKAKI